MIDDSEKTRWDLAEEIAALVVTGVWLAAMFAGFEYWLALMLFGYIVVVGGISVLGEYMESRERTTDDEAAADEVDREDPVERLQRRYVDGEIDETEYERRLDTVLSTDAEREDVAGPAELDRRRDRERELE